MKNFDLLSIGTLALGILASSAQAKPVHAQWCRAQCVQIDPANHMIHFLGSKDAIAEDRFGSWQDLEETCYESGSFQIRQAPILVSGFFLMDKQDHYASSYSSFSSSSSSQSGSASANAVYARQRSKVLEAASAQGSYSYSGESENGSNGSYSVDQDLNLSFEFADPNTGKTPACSDTVIDDSQLIPVYNGDLPVDG